MADTSYLKCSCIKCGNHIEFPRTMSGSTVTCPHCGQTTELVPGQNPAALAKPPAAAPQARRTGFKLLAGICAILVIAAAAFLGWKHFSASARPPGPTKPAPSAPTNSPPPVAAVPEPPAIKRPKSPDDLKVGEIKLENTKGSSLVYAVGTLTNDSDYQRFGVRVEVELLNRQEAKVGTAQDYHDLIEPHKSWQFRALVIDSQTASARLSSIKED